MPELELVLEAMEKHARPIMLTAVRPDSCIAMTAVSIEILGRFGFEAYPMYAECIIVNAKFQELHDAGRISVWEHLPDWAVDQGAWAIGLGVYNQRQDPDAAGHVVTMCERYMLDLSIDQATRRLRDINLKPSVYNLPEDPFKEPIQYYQEGTLLTYRLRPELNTWHDSPDWKRYKTRYKDPIGRIIRAVRKELG